MIQVIRIDRQTWGIKSGFSNVVRFECKATPGMRWDDPNKAWVGYADAVAVTAARLRKRGLQIIGGVDGAVGIPTMPVAEKGLRGYQIKGVEFLIAKAEEGCILADEVAMGKSAQAATAARALKRKTVIVCPSFGRSVWLDPKDGELRKWWKDAKAIGLKGVKPEHNLAVVDLDIVVIHFDILYAWVDILIAWGAETLIVDELHYCMGGSSRRTNAVAKLAEACRFRMGLTGTPMTSRPRDLHAPVEAISKGRFGKFFAYGLCYCAGKQEQIEIRVEGVKTTRNIWKFDGSSKLDELNARMNYSPATPWGFMLRRLKSEVALELPARTRQIVTLDVARNFVTPIGSAVKSDKLLRQALNSAADGKFPQVIDLVVGHLEAGLKVVVGAHRRAIVATIAEGVAQKGPWRIETLTGETPMKKREEILKSQPDLLCATLDSTAGAINLSFASVGVVAELVWVPSVLTQWEGRFGREPGRNVLIQYCIAKNSIESLIKRALIQKLDAFTSAVGRTDDRLQEDFRGLEGSSAAERMQKLYQRLKEQDK